MNTRSLYKVLSLILLFAVLLAACTATPTPTAEVTEPEEAEAEAAEWCNGGWRYHGRRCCFPG